jgi:hypothetical protein
MADLQRCTDRCPEPSLANLNGQALYSRVSSHGQVERDAQFVASIFPPIVRLTSVLPQFHANRLERTTHRILTVYMRDTFPALLGVPVHD